MPENTETFPWGIRRQLRELAEQLGIRRSTVPSEGRRGPIFDSVTDTRWAQEDARFASVLHVFHAEWPGIRAAAGYSPGRKVAIQSERQLLSKEIAEVLEYLQREQITAVVIHGCSSNVFLLIDALRRAWGKDIRIQVVWHGSTAQFANPFELEWFGQILSLRKRGVVDAFGAVKPGLSLLDDALFVAPLLNLPPRLDREPNRSSAVRSAFIVAPTNWHKNFYTALFAAAGSERIDEVLVTSEVELPTSLHLRARLRVVGQLGRDALFQLIEGSTAVLNPSLSECQPMIALESLALGVPCVTGPLGLGALDEHPYQRLVQLADVGSLGLVRTGLERVLELREGAPELLREMMESYRVLLRSAAIERLAEFLSR